MKKLEGPKMSTFGFSVSIWTQQMFPRLACIVQKSQKIRTRTNKQTNTNGHHFLNVFHTKSPRGKKYTDKILGNYPQISWSKGSVQIWSPAWRLRAWSWPWPWFIANASFFSRLFFQKFPLRLPTKIMIFT